MRGRPGDGSPVNRGTLCVRGAYGYDFVHSPERLTTPLVRGPDGLEPASWDKALEVAAAELRRIKRDAGPASLAVLGSPAGTNEENYLLQRFARCVLGTPNIDNGARLHRAPSYTGLGGTLGYPGTIGTISDIECAEVILVVGADPAASAPAVGYAIKRAVTRKGARLLLLEPRKTQLARFANLWLRPRPGTDIALLNGLAALIVSEGQVDRELVTIRTDGFSELAGRLGRYTPEYVEQVTGVPAEDLRRAARMFGGAGRAAIIYGGGVTRSRHGTDTVKALANLALLTGNVERKGTGLYALQARNNAQGACDMGAMPDLLPGYRSVDDAESRRRFEERWGTQLPVGSGLTAIDMMTAAVAGHIRGMVIVGENPVASFPDPPRSSEVWLRSIFSWSRTSSSRRRRPWPQWSCRPPALSRRTAPSPTSKGGYSRSARRCRLTAKAGPTGRSSWPWRKRWARRYPSRPWTTSSGRSPNWSPSTRAVSGGRGCVNRSARGAEPWARRRLHERLFPSTFGRFLPVDYVPRKGPRMNTL